MPHHAVGRGGIAAYGEFQLVARAVAVGITLGVGRE
jgi:hypothetical protein